MRLGEIRGGASERRSLLLDTGEEIKSTAQVVSDLSLHAGSELSEREYLSVKRESARATAKLKAADYLGARAMSRGELIKKLGEKGWDEDASACAADWLEELGVLDDADYAGMIVRHYAARGCGAGRIKEELYRRAVPREYWDEALEELPDQSGTVDSLLARKLDGTAEDRAAVKRATDFLRRRGFGWDEIASALSRRAENM